MDFFDQKQTIYHEIYYLISLHQEGGYWDFKKQWYDNSGNLLHDIICMANNLHNRAAYIIIGIDEEQGFSVADISSDPNRRNTQQIVDFLKDKKFAGGIRPVVHVESVCLNKENIDVIVIENSRDTPYYLTKRCEKVCANSIYTRVMDTNTPADMSADINHIEYLWRKRFHLDDTPIEKFCYYLENPDDWETIQDRDMGYFYKFAPEYTITCEKDETADGYEYYIFGQVNTTPSWWRITLRYYQTAIEHYQGIALDGGRSFVVAPKRSYDLLNTGISHFGLYIYDDLRYRLLEFYHHQESPEEYSYNQYTKAIVLFGSEQEYNLFLDYVQTHKGRYTELCTRLGDAELPPFPDLAGYNMDEFKKQYCDALVMQKMLEEYRDGTQTIVMEDEANADA